MSHWTTIKTQIRDMQALGLACSELRLKLVQNGIARGYGSQTKQAEWVIKLPEPCPYDIALERNPDGTFTLVTDWYLGHVAKLVGENFKKLVQLYGVHKATIEARKKNLNVQRKAMADGSIRLAITGGAL